MNPTSTVGRAPALSREALDFAPGLLSIQESPPAPLPKAILHSVLALTVILLLWATFGKLDVIASAEGRLVPQSYIKIVQPAEAGIVKEILVHEGEAVQAGQVLLRMDPQEAEADSQTIATTLALKRLQLRRIAAELSGVHLRREEDDPPDLFRKVAAQFEDRRQAYRDSLAGAQDGYLRAQHESEAGHQALEKLRQTNPLLKSQAEAYADLGKEGYAAQVVINDKQREYVENTQDLRAQESKIASLASTVAEAHQQASAITSKYRSDLQNERVEAEGELTKLQQDWAKQTHKAGLLELRAPQAGLVKDLGTHTVGTVVASGTVLLSLVPEHEPMLAEILIRNEDVGFVHFGQAVQLKLAAFPFQKYGMVPGKVLHIWPDAAEGEKSDRFKESSSSAGGAYGYKALVGLGQQALHSAGAELSLVPGMQVVAEINEGRRTVLEYLLSPVQKTLKESGRER